MPLQLWYRPHWELRGRADSVVFFGHLREALPGATTLFVEGTSIGSDVEDFLRSAREAGVYIPDRQTHWPRPKQYRVRCDDPTLAGLVALAKRHAEPEILDHLFVYDGSQALLEFHDAFMSDSLVLISVETEEQRIRDFASVLGLTLNRAAPAGTER